MERIRFFNAKTYDDDGVLHDIELTVDNSLISAVSCGTAAPTAAQQYDCGGAVLLPGFIDGHLHLPGSLLYQRHGVDLMGEGSISDYQTILQRFSVGTGTLRGFGWSQRVFQDVPGALSRFQQFLNETFPTRPVLLFSDDYHSCICNRALLRKTEAFLSPTQTDFSTGLLTERAVFALLHAMPELSFSREETEDALLAYQTMLLSRGITAVQTLMPIGMSEDTCWDVLHDLERRGLWHIRTHFAVTAHPADAPETILARIRSLQAQQTEHIRLNTVKIYIDGVVDNGSACLSRPYEDSESCGNPIWETASLRRFCTFFDRENLQIHAHVIGDAAAAQITGALTFALRQNGRTHNENRHVLAHVQLADPAVMEEMAQYSLLCALQPFWFPQDTVYAVDRALLGKRSETEYPCASLLHRGISVAFGSDSPVTADPSPLAGISCAMRRMDTPERLTFSEALRAFTASGAYQLFSEHEIGRLAPGYHADFLLLSPPDPDQTSPISIPDSVIQTYVGGKCVYQA